MRSYPRLKEDISNLDYEDCRSDLLRRLKERFYLLCETLTSHQKSVLSLYLKGLSMEKMAEVKGISYRAIYHALYGVEMKGCKSDIHGGIVRRLKKLITKDGESLVLLERLSRLSRMSAVVAREETIWDLYLEDFMKKG